MNDWIMLLLPFGCSNDVRRIPNDTDEREDINILPIPVFGHPQSQKLFQDCEQFKKARSRCGIAEIA